MEESLFYTGKAKRSNGMLSVSMKNGEKLAKQLRKLESGGEKAIKRTVADFTSRAPAWVTKGTRQHYGVDTAAIKNAGPKKRRNSSVKISGIHVAGAALVYEGHTLTLIHFGMSPKARPSGRQSKLRRVPGQAINTAGGSPVAMIAPPKKYTVKATIIKGKREKMKQGTFIASGKGGSTLPFQRTTDSRLPIEVVRTLSVPQMISGRAKETIEEMIGTNLEKRFEHHIQQAMK